MSTVQDAADAIAARAAADDAQRINDALAQFFQDAGLQAYLSRPCGVFDSKGNALLLSDAVKIIQDTIIALRTPDVISLKLNELSQKILRS